MTAPLHHVQKIICGIDFGTSGSGFGFSIDKVVTVEEKWEDAAGPVSKTLTQILYDGTKVVAWGFSAPKVYSTMLANCADAGTPTDQLFLLEYFKMAIKDNPDGMLTVPHTNKQFSVLAVVTDFLRELWKKISVRIQDVYKKEVNATDIRWCLSIPAIWKDNEKAFMRKAAFQAGLISTENASEDYFMLILEPEAAAACCIEECKNNGYPLVEGATFLVVDAGGGTIDLTSHQVVGGKLCEYTEGSGDKFGSSMVNKAFLEYLNTLLGVQKMEEFRSKSPIDYYDLMVSIESHKCQIQDCAIERLIKLPSSLTKTLATPKPANFNQASKNLRLDPATLTSIFTPTLTQIERLVQQQFDAAAQKPTKKTFDYMFVVGGFGESEVLTKMLKDKFGKNTVIMKPKKPIRAVISGAVMLGCDPSLIRGRKMRLTYGVNTFKPFDPASHKLEKQITIEGRTGLWCKDLFDKFVSRGDEVLVDSCEERTYKPQFADQTSMSLGLYHTPKSNVQYVDEENLIHTGQIIIDMSNTTGGLARSVHVKFYFGQSEIKVEAVESVSTTKYTATINFEGLSVSFVAPTQQPKNHIILINDASGSMGEIDMHPSLPWIPHKNRLGALYESCYTLLKQREKSGDVVSCVTYSDDAVLQFSALPLVDAEATIKKLLLLVPPYAGTNFLKPVKLLHSILANNPTGTTPIAFFMTDGECYDNGAPEELQTVMDTFKKIRFSLHTVLLAENESRAQLLKQLAQIGKGNFYFSKVDLNAMKQMYTALAALLE